MEAADRTWSSLNRGDRLEAYRAHPRLSGRESRRPRLVRTAAGPPDDNDPASLAALAQADLTYEAKFGHPFFVPETDARPNELLAKIRRRLVNDPDDEDLVAAEDQVQIFRRALRAFVS